MRSAIFDPHFANYGVHGMNVGLAKARGVLSCDCRGVVFPSKAYMSTDSGATTGFRLDGQFSIHQTKSQIRSIGIDLGKTTFHLVALGNRCQVVVRKKLSRQQLLNYTANLSSCMIGMEACVGSHFLGRALREQGYEVRLIPAQFVRPFVKSNKNDYRDAEAIAEAVERENMRFVPIKTEDQLDVQALHRVRERLVSRRTSVINQIRALMLSNVAIAGL